ncbi:mechanosensitive ion channel family protein [Rhizobium sp. L1K21]|uniref:mechanosensitive ion channel family protein n=1 Tax=Rhizobium sp. L1K21 TaxID=2954933 RepID=UPI002092B0A8|nr:mechanosensitive ion channel family protein [Rhizobium sp. L1K21]MCO6187649.1 mechanosensitive ion channel family protein [Rhizobium sp. L1K21]
MTDFRRPSISLLAVFLGVLCLAFAQFGTPAAAQSIPGVSSSSQDSTSEALSQVIEDAKSNGARIIVIEPQSQTAAPAEQMSMMTVFSSTSLLKARWLFVDMVDDAIKFYQELPRRMAAMGPDGTSAWLLRAIATATAGFLLGAFVFRMVTRWGRKRFAEESLAASRSKRLSNKLGATLFRVGWMVFSLIIAFVTAMFVAVIFDSDHQPTREFIWDILTTYTAYRFIRTVVFWNFFAPDISDFRLINLSDQRAQRLFRDWVIVLSVAALLVCFCRLIGQVKGDTLEASYEVSAAVRMTIIACEVIVTLMLLALTISHRADTEMMVLGEGDPRSKPTWRRIMAVLATPLMIIYILFAFATSSLRIILQAENGLLPLAAPFMVFMAAIFVYGVALFLLEKIYERAELNYYRRRKDKAVTEAKMRRRELQAMRMAQGMDDEDARLASGEEMEVHLSEDTPIRTVKYFPAFKPFFETAIQATVLMISIGELFRLWGYGHTMEAGHPISAALNTLLVVIIAWGAYRALNKFIDFKIITEGGTLDSDPIQPGESDGEGGKGQSRLVTLLPIFRNVLVSLIAAVVIVVVLSNMGVDVAPLFAGAGVVGIAVGFGAQTLIRDIFSGAFFLIDDAFRKGEYIEIDTTRGIVEKISMRSFQLRHHLGAVHTIPFGEIKRITNYSRDWVMMKLPLRLTYDTDVERVRKLIKKLGEQLANDPETGQYFLQPLKSQGVYAMEDSAMIIRVKFMTRPGDQFIMRKAVYAAIRDLFQREGIKFAHREVTVRIADTGHHHELTPEEEKAVTGAVRTILDEDDEKAAGGKRKAASYEDM